MNSNIYLLIQKVFTLILILVLQPKNADKAWTIAAFIFFAFLILNAGMLWFDDHPWRYFLYSLGFAVGYILLSGMIVQVLIKVLKLEGAGETAMAFVTVIYHPFALLLVMLIKWTVSKLF